MDDLINGVPGDMLEIGDESEKEGQAQMVKRNGKVEELKKRRKF